MERCKQKIHSGNLGIIKTQCMREAIRDGYCWQHHPIVVKKREDKAEKRLANRPLYLMRRPTKFLNDRA